MIHPTFITPAEVRTIRDRIAANADARLIAEESILKPALAALKRPLDVPPPMATRHSTYFDLAAGVKLIFDPDSPHAHRDALGGVHHGEAYDRGWSGIRHNINANDARTCALAAVLWNHREAATRARHTLFTYAAGYRDYPPMGRMTATWGRVMSSALEEAGWIIPLLWGAELLSHDGSLSDSELDTLRRDLFEPAVDLLWGEWYFIHNIRMWCNAAIGSIGLAFGDRLAIRHAIHGDKGYRQQQIDGFRADGLHFEGSVGYHSYGLTAMLVLAEAMQRNGYAPYADDYLKAAMLVPFQLVQPNGAIPAINDYWPVRSLPTRYLGTALLRFPDDEQIRDAAAEAFAVWREHGCSFDRTAADWNCTPAYYGRSQADWLLAWDRIEPHRRFSPPQRHVMPASGLAVLRPKASDYLLLKCSALGSGHDHHDKLSVIWWRNGYCWLGDMGTTSYGSPLHERWFKHTLGHNTSLADGRAHERCDARLVACDADSMLGHAQPYPKQMPDVRMDRQLVIGMEDQLIDSFHVTADRPRTFDYVLRPMGELIRDGSWQAESQAVEGHDPAYGVLRDSAQVRFGGPSRLRWLQGDAVLTVDMGDLDNDTEVWIARAPVEVEDAHRLGDMLILRRTSIDTTFEVTMKAGVHVADDRAPYREPKLAHAELITAGPDATTEQRRATRRNNATGGHP